MSGPPSCRRPIRACSTSPARSSSSRRCERIHGRHEDALRALIEEKRRGLPVRPSAASAQDTNVVNLVDALRKSLQGGRNRGLGTIMCGGIRGSARTTCDQTR
jgi:hypothetical protein